MDEMVGKRNLSVKIIRKKSTIDNTLYLFLQGTLIRVFDAATRKLIVELRRGADTAMFYWSVILLTFYPCNRSSESSLSCYMYTSETVYDSIWYIFFNWN